MRGPGEALLIVAAWFALLATPLYLSGQAAEAALEQQRMEHRW